MVNYALAKVRKGEIRLSTAMTRVVVVVVTSNVHQVALMVGQGLRPRLSVALDNSPDFVSGRHDILVDKGRGHLNHVRAFLERVSLPHYLHHFSDSHLTRQTRQELSQSWNEWIGYAHLDSARQNIWATSLPRDDKMDAFVTRTSKKRKPSPELLATPADEAPEESTDIKLAILSSLHPDIDQETLLDILLAHDGDVEATTEALKTRHLTSRKPSSSNTVTSQTSLRSFAVDSSSMPSDLSSPPSKRTKVLSKKGQTLHLYDPKDIAEHTPCSIIHNFLPAAEANALLIELLEESKTFEKITFKLFDNVVSSPHTSGFYVGTAKELQEQKHDYVYNGARLAVSPGSPSPCPFIITNSTFFFLFLGRQNAHPPPRACPL